jgi:hypothetical protein
VARHHHFLDPEAVAAAVNSIVTTPPGAHLTLVEVQPVAPIRPDQRGRDAPSGTKGAG